MGSVVRSIALAAALASAVACAGPSMPPSAAASRAATAMPVVAMTWAPPSGQSGGPPVAVTADGAIVVGGKTYGKIVDDAILDAAGKRRFTVSADGTVTAAGTESPGFRFVGDELVTDEGDRLSVDGTGNVTFTPARGTPRSAGRFDHGAEARRVAALVALLLVPAGSSQRAEPSGPPAAVVTPKP